MKNQRRTISNILLGLAIILTAASLLASTLLGINLEIMMHAAEGAMIGGICDWFALTKMYSTISGNQHQIAAEIGTWVEKELLTAQTIAARLDKLAKDQATRDKIYLWLDRQIGNQSDAQDLIINLWKQYLKSHAIERIASYQLSSSELSAATSATLQPELTSAFSICIGNALKSVASQKAELNYLIDKYAGGALSAAIGKLIVSGKINEIADKLITGKLSIETTSKENNLDSLLQSAIEAHIKTWNKIPKEDRKKAVSALFDTLESHVIAALAAELINSRDQLRRAGILAEHPLVKQALENSEMVINNDLSSTIGNTVTNALNEISPQELKENLEQRTRHHLELIRINGTLLGGVLGLLMGSILHILK